MGIISDDTQVLLAEEREELIAKSETLWDALDHCYRIAKRGRLDKAEADEALARVVDLIASTRKALDDMLNAGLKRGLHYEMQDEELQEWYDAVDRQFHLLSPEGKRRFVAARKRATRDERRDEARADAVTSEGTAPAVRSLTLHTTTNV